MQATDLQYDTWVKYLANCETLGIKPSLKDYDLWLQEEGIDDSD